MFSVKPNRCNCHPETCACNPWSVVDDKDKYITSFWDHAQALEYAIFKNKEELERVERKRAKKKNPEAAATIQQYRNAIVATWHEMGLDAKGVDLQYFFTLIDQAVIADNLKKQTA